MAIAEENEDVQKLGTVSIIYLLDEYKMGFDLELVRMVHKLLKSLPWKIAAHYILVQEDSAWTQVIDFSRHLMSQRLRLRSRSISGTYSECMYTLRCVGIPCESLPVTEEGSDEICEYHQRWMECRKEESTTTVSSSTKISSEQVNKKRHMEDPDSPDEVCFGGRRRKVLPRLV
jgi:hypothetical protein